MSVSPTIEATIINVQPWRKARSGPEYRAFRLRDASGEMRGTMYKPITDHVENKFKVRKFCNILLLLIIDLT